MAYDEASSRRSMPMAMKAWTVELAMRAASVGSVLSTCSLTRRELRTGSTVSEPRKLLTTASRPSTSALRALGLVILR